MNDMEQLYLRAQRYVHEYRDTSCAGLQRHLRIGYRAALQLQEKLGAAGLYEGIRRVVEPAQWTIRAVGIGAAGCNALDTMVAALLDRVEVVALKRENPAALQRTRTRTLARANGDSHAEDMATIASALAGANMLFVAAGLGGRFAARMATLAVRAARSTGTPCIVTAYMPAPYEGAERNARAAAALSELARDSDAVLVSSLTPRCPAEEAGSMVELLDTRNREFAALVHTVTALLTDERVLRPSFNELLLLLNGRLWMGRGRGEGAAAVSDATRLACTQLLESAAIAPVDTLFAIVRTHPSARFIRLARLTEAANAVTGPKTRVSIAYQQDERLCDSVDVTLLAARRSGH